MDAHPDKSRAPLFGGSCVGLGATTIRSDTRCQWVFLGALKSVHADNYFDCGFSALGRAC